MRVLDLFCGCGGTSEGLKQAGIPVTLAVDNWEIALNTHAANHPDTEHLKADINVLDPTTLGHFDVVVGSPPCPDFSVANNKRDPVRGMVLVRKFLETIDEIRPRWWFLENVPGVADYLPGGIPRIALLNSADYGVPQIRRRIFAGSFVIPRPTHAESARQTLDRKRLAKWISVREALGLEGSCQPPRLALWNGEGRTALPIDLDSPASVICDLSKTPLESPAPTVVPGHRDHRGGAGGRAAWQRIGVSRRLEPWECAALQGFPRDYIWTGSKTAVYRQIGNAVPPPMARAIAEAGFR